MNSTNSNDSTSSIDIQTNKSSSYPPLPQTEQPSFFLNKLMQRMKIPKTVWVLGLAMCLINISYVVVYSLSALYLHTSLGIGLIWITVLEGFVEALSYLMKLFSGVVSDFFRKRKPIMLVGYFLTFVSKPILALSASGLQAFFARVFERLGNGIQATPRDAMVGDVAPLTHRASSFGLLRTLGTAGSFCGGILGYSAMVYTGNEFSTVFWVAAVPAFFAFCILTIFAKEPKTHVAADGSITKLRSDRRPIHFSDIRLLGKNYWILMVIVFIFMLARFSETLIVLHAHTNFGLDKSSAPLIMSTYNFTYSLFSYPLGFIADRLGRRFVLILGVSALIASDFFLYSAENIETLFIGILIWGIQMGAVHNTFVSLITDYVPEDLRGTSIGLYYLVGTLASLAVGLLSGSITHYFGYPGMFLLSMIIASISLVALLILLPKNKKQHP